VPLIPEKIANKIVIKQAVKYANEANQIIVPTPGIKKIIKNWGVTNEKIEPIATGIEEEFYQNTDRKKIRDKFGIQEKETLLLLVSRITQEKNIEFLFNSVIEILKKNSEVKFLIAGDGYLLPKLKNITLKNNLQNRIFFQGIVEKNELKNYYSAGDIFVYSSKSETQGMVISEAMYCGLPVVAIFAPGVSDLVQTNINGFLIEEKENEFISALEKLIENRNLRNIFSENSKKIARELYTDKVCAQKMLLIYESLIQCHSERV
jgi:glycosyltransferase involved in cell wall biosynthesis